MGSSPDQDRYTCRRVGFGGIYMMDIVRGIIINC